jgi:hypothetical protein
MSNDFYPGENAMERFESLFKHLHVLTGQIIVRNYVLFFFLTKPNQINRKESQDLHFIVNYANLIVDLEEHICEKKRKKIRELTYIHLGLMKFDLHTVIKKLVLGLNAILTCLSKSKNQVNVSITWSRRLYNSCNISTCDQISRSNRIPFSLCIPPEQYDFGTVPADVEFHFLKERRGNLERKNDKINPAHSWFRCKVTFHSVFREQGRMARLLHLR